MVPRPRLEIPRSMRERYEIKDMNERERKLFINLFLNVNNIFIKDIHVILQYMSLCIGTISKKKKKKSLSLKECTNLHIINKVMRILFSFIG